MHSSASSARLRSGCNRQTRYSKNITRTIDLPPETLEALRADAGALGRPAEQVAEQYLASLFALDADEETIINAALDELDAGYVSQTEKMHKLAAPGMRVSKQ